MAAELQPPGSPVAATAVAAPPTAENPGSGPGPGPGPALALALAPKRHRRPSVRLGDIGDQPATPRTSKSWRLHPYPAKSSKTRPLTNLVTSTNGGFDPNSDYSPETHNSGCSHPHRKLPKFRRTTGAAKRLRTGHLRIDPAKEAAEDTINGGNHNNGNDNDVDDSFRDDDEEGFRGSEQESPLHSADDGALLDAWHGHNRRSTRVAGGASTRISDSRHHLGLDGFPESDSRNRSLGYELDLDDGVRNWLVELGLGRYAPVFEIHEVDDEVLPHLTLEDLRDMGINAVGSRRKLYTAIQKLQKRLS